jgi:hypothetical protein
VFKDPVDVRFAMATTTMPRLFPPVAPENRRVLVASPEWIARHGEPQTPEALASTMR